MALAIGPTMDRVKFYFGFVVVSIIFESTLFPMQPTKMKSSDDDYELADYYWAMPMSGASSVECIESKVPTTMPWLMEGSLFTNADSKSD